MLLQKHAQSEVYWLNFVEVADIQLLQIELLAMCLGCHGSRCSWYTAALIIFVVDCKVLIHDYLCQILFTVLDFCESYEAQCACPIF